MRSFIIISCSSVSMPGCDALGCTIFSILGGTESYRCHIQSKNIHMCEWEQKPAGWWWWWWWSNDISNLMITYFCLPVQQCGSILLLLLGTSHLACSRGERADILTIYTIILYIHCMAWYNFIKFNYIDCHDQSWH